MTLPSEHPDTNVGIKSEEALREKCVEIQLLTGLHDGEWYDMFGNKGGLYGFLAEQIRLAYGRGSVDTIEHVKSWADKTEATYNEMLSERITELRKVGGTEWVKDTLRRKP